MTRLKICGIKRPETLALLKELDVDYVGLVFAPSKRKVDAKTAGGCSLPFSATRRLSACLSIRRWMSWLKCSRKRRFLSFNCTARRRRNFAAKCESGFRCRYGRHWLLEAKRMPPRRWKRIRGL